MKYYIITPIWDYDGVGGGLEIFDTIEEVEAFINGHLAHINKYTGFRDTVFTGKNFTVICGDIVKTKDVEIVTKVKLETN